jgi:septum formation protein
MRHASIRLASSSPRRSALLDQIGVRHVVEPADVDETQRRSEVPGDYVLRLARAKAEHVWERRSVPQWIPVLAADTAVVIDAEVLGKPMDREAGLTMLARLSGRTHEVLTAIAVRSTRGLATALSVSRVRFRALTPEECDRYWATGEPADKAGGYAVQGLGAVFIAHLAGSYSGVMGLPLHETAELLVAADVQLWLHAPSP